MTELKYLIVDVFTDTPLAGNPVAVFLEASFLDSDTMQRIANEMHLSETVFVGPVLDDGSVEARIFTPVNELAFAGHPTLGTAIGLSHISGHTNLRMTTPRAVVQFDVSQDSRGVRSATMTQPIPQWEVFEHWRELQDALGLDRGNEPLTVYDNGPRHVLVPVSDRASLSALAPDHRALAVFPNMAANCYAGSGTEWALRMFSPAYGVVEDAATGSAAGALAVHLTRHGLIAPGEWIRISQGAEIGRPSLMHARALGAGQQVTAVEVAGEAVVVGRGSLGI